MGDEGVPISYGDLGRRDGRTVVLCHGLGANGRQFASDGAHFASLDYRVLVPDLRGHGESGVPNGRSEETFSIDRMGADLIAMLDDAGVEEVGWVGNSLGGIVALPLLRSAPQRFRTFATFGTTYDLALPLPRVAAQAFPLTYGIFGPRLTAAFASHVTTHKASARLVVADMLRQFHPSVGKAVVKNVAHYDFIADAASFERPILLMRGGRDYRVNAGLKPTLDAMTGRPNFTFVKLRGGGHCANLDANEAWRAALLGFWHRTGAIA